MAKSIEQTTGPYWTKNWIEAMWRFTVENFVEFDTNNVDFEALGREEYEFRKALFYRNFKNSPRAKEAFAEVKESYKSHVESGRQGGRPRKNPEENIAETADLPVHSGKNSRSPNSREDFHAFVADNNLHEGLAEEWYAIHEARGWVDENGSPIKNWKGALYNYCTKTEQKRRTA